MVSWVSWGLVCKWFDRIGVLISGLPELFAATVFMTMFHMDVENSDDFGDMEAVPKMARATYEIPVMKRALQRILPELMYKGLLDV